jgi:alanyl-tRNA synthetase
MGTEQYMPGESHNMTKHLYYEDSYLTEFAAIVIDKFTVGQKPAVVLDQTAFYPASGGQPCDTGALGGARVESVEEEESGRIIHILDASPPSGEVRGCIDWSRRFDHMQQHTGQHILSQAFLGVTKASTLSFHLGLETSTIDLDLAQADPRILQQVEELAARVVFEDRIVRILNVSRQELPSLGVRKESRREGEIRVIDIDGFDRSPCGGTHVRRCGEVGLIFILGSERYKGGTRIEFVCGGRVLRSFRKDHEVLRELAKLYSAHPHELSSLAEKFLQERSALLRDKMHLEGQLLEMEAQELRDRAGETGGIAEVYQSYSDRKIESLKILAQKITASPRALAILCIAQEPAQLVVARSADVQGDCGAAIKLLAGKLGGKGGGRPELAQAGGIAGSALEEWSQAILDYFRRCRQETE